MWNKPVLVLWHSRPKCVPRLQLWTGDGDENTWSVKTVKMAQFLEQDSKAENSCLRRWRFEAAGMVSCSPCDPHEPQHKRLSRFAVIVQVSIGLSHWIGFRTNLEFNETFIYRIQKMMIGRESAEDLKQKHPCASTRHQHKDVCAGTQTQA